MRTPSAGIQARGRVGLVDTALLDAVVPAVDELGQAFGDEADATSALERGEQEAVRRADA